jgi:hypothetical protein
VILNTYEKDGSRKQVLINYTDREVSYEGYTLEALSALVVE